VRIPAIAGYPRALRGGVGGLPGGYLTFLIVLSKSTQRNEHSEMTIQ
jgi:hypothetical protein